MPTADTPSSAVVLDGANDNAPGAASVALNGGTLAYPSITAAELEILKPLILSLASMAANDL